MQHVFIQLYNQYNQLTTELMRTKYLLYLSDELLCYIIRKWNCDRELFQILFLFFFVCLFEKKKTKTKTCLTNNFCILPILKTVTQ